MTISPQPEASIPFVGILRERRSFSEGGRERNIGSGEVIHLAAEAFRRADARRKGEEESIGSKRLKGVRSRQGENESLYFLLFPLWLKGGGGFPTYSTRCPGDSSR